MIKSAEQLLCIQKQKKQTDFADANKIFKLEKVDINNNFGQTNENVEQSKEEDKNIIPLKNPMNKNILVSNDFHLETSTNSQRRIKPPNRNPNMEDLKYNSYLESKLSPEYLRNYDKESLKNIDNYYIDRKENLQVLSRFGNWVTLKPDDKNRSHALEKLKHGTYETSIVAPSWMDIAARRKNQNINRSQNDIQDYDYMDLNNKMFKRQEYNTSIRDKGKMTILQDVDQKNVKPVYLRDSYEKNKILLDYEAKESLKNNNQGNFF
jgi:hypothetical protein